MFQLDDGRWPYVLLASVVVVAGCGSSSSPVGSEGDENENGNDEPTVERTVVVLSDGGSEVHVSEMLTEAGITVIDGGPFHEFTGDGLDLADAVVALAGPEYNNDMDDEGEAALLGFVLQGGGLVATERLTRSIEEQGFHPIFQNVLPVEYGDSFIEDSDGETYTISATHPVTDGLPSSFDIPAGSSWSVVAPKTDATTLITGSESGSALVAWEAPGRVVAWNSAVEFNSTAIWTDDVDRMLENAVVWAASGDREVEDIETARLFFRPNLLLIRHDGDGPAGSTNSPGEFRIQVGLTMNLNGVQSYLARAAPPSVQGVDETLVYPGEDFHMFTTLPLLDGLQVTARLSFFENDPDGPQASVGNTWLFTYRADEDCWEREETETSVGSSCVGIGEIAGDHLLLSDYTGDPLFVRLYWRFDWLAPE